MKFAVNWDFSVPVRQQVLLLGMLCDYFFLKLLFPRKLNIYTTKKCGVFITDLEFGL